MSIEQPTEGQVRNMVFISHATPEDNEVARWLALRLAAEGYPVWCDLTKLLGGEPFWKEIESAIRDRACKFIFLLSKASNEKQGTRDELEVAATIRRQVGDERFIIPVRVDDMKFSDANIRIHGLNIIDLTGSWISGFQKLVERLQDDAVATDDRFTQDAVAVWWRQNFAQDEGVTPQEESYLTNEFPITRMPEDIRVIGLRRQPKDELSPEDSPHPIAAHKRFLVSFAEPRDLLPFLERNRLHFDEGCEDVPLDRFLERGYYRAIDPRTARNLARYLFRQAASRFPLTRGLKSYTIANNRTYSWFPKGLLTEDKISFQTADVRNVRRQLVGYSTCTAKDESVYLRYWHFGVELIPWLGKNEHVTVLPHVCFSEGEEPYESPRKQHRLRRSQCRRWYNDDWRDRILASIHYLADGKPELMVPLSPDSSFAVATFSTATTSPVSYVRVIDDTDADDARSDSAGDYDRDGNEPEEGDDE